MRLRQAFCSDRVRLKYTELLLLWLSWHTGDVASHRTGESKTLQATHLGRKVACQLGLLPPLYPGAGTEIGQSEDTLMTDPNQPNSPEWAAEFDARLDATTTDETARMSKRQSAAIIALE